ncbi:MAG: CBS domain-containing protein [Rhodospirillales bacterium]|nr:CBS domain-containing protein [Rhodospirillales bacterium]MSP79443.1 CBS domain-containing protein [Rhodospirillales bacterium]
MKVSDILKAKGTRILTVRPEEAVSTFIKRTVLEKVGAMVVSTDGTLPEGLVTERDIVHGLARHGAELLAMPVREVMTRKVLTCAPADSIQDVMIKMTEGRTRHLPVMEGGRLAGMISIGDVVKSRLENAELEAAGLRDYITAVG